MEKSRNFNKLGKAILGKKEVIFINVNNYNTCLYKITFFGFLINAFRIFISIILNFIVCYYNVIMD